MILGALTAGVAGFGQLPLPDLWTKVRWDQQENTYFDGAKFRADYPAFTYKKPSKAAEREKWRVFTNRAGVQMLDAPSDGANVRRNLGFNEILWAYEEKDQYLRIGDDSKPLGWVHKQDLILWITPLRDMYSGIEVKAFAVNTTRASTRISKRDEDKDLFPVYDSPSGGTVIAERPLYDVLFVFQYAPGQGAASGRYLVSDNFELNRASPLLGWVSEARLKLWSTNLCLEPNWKQEAMAERRGKDIYAHIFESGTQEKNNKRDAYFKGTNKESSSALFANPRDPAFEVQDAERRDRLEGFLFRYPIFGGELYGEDNCAFFTGAPARLDAGIYSITEGAARKDNYRAIQNEYEVMSKRFRNLNVVFLVEAGPGKRVSWARSAMEALRKADAGSNRLSMGAVVYYNDDASRPDQRESYIVKKQLSPNGDGLTEWLNQQDMAERGDEVDTRPAFRALARALEMLPDGETNVVVHMYSLEDHSISDLNDERPGYMDTRMLKDAVAKNSNSHYLGYILPTEEAMDAADTYEQAKTQLLMGLAVGMREKYAQIMEQHSGKAMESSKPMEGYAGGQRTVQMKPASLVLKSRVCDEGTDYGGLVEDAVGECQRTSQEFLDMLNKVLYDGSIVKEQADPLAAEASYSLVAQLCSDVSRDKDAAKSECLTYAFANKVHFFMDASTMYRSTVLGTPVFNYVVFMKQTMLSERINSLNNLISKIDGKLLNVTRDAMEDHWKGNAVSIMGKGDQNLSLDQILERMYGIEKMNIVKPFQDEGLYGGLKLKDLHDAKKFTDDKVIQMAGHFRDQLDGLRAVRASDDLQYRIGKGRDIYYWVPIEYLMN